MHRVADVGQIQNLVCGGLPNCKSALCVINEQSFPIM